MNHDGHELKRPMLGVGSSDAGASSQRRPQRWRMHVKATRGRDDERFDVPSSYAAFAAALPRPSMSGASDDSFEATMMVIAAHHVDAQSAAVRSFRAAADVARLPRWPLEEISGETI